MYKRITICIIAKLADDLSIISKKKRVSLNSLVSEIVWDFVKNWNIQYENINYSDTINPIKK